METLTAQADGKSAALTGTFKGDATALFAVPFATFTARAGPPVQAAPPVVEEVKPDKPEKK
jgi:hypothetical protein